jgi:zinc/manganese transport system ATP-binding protein
VSVQIQSRSESGAERSKRESESVVELDHVIVRLGGRTILRDLTVRVVPGEFVGVIGPNGAGKTTTLRVILGLQRPSAGVVRVFGQPPRRGNPRIGYVPQYQVINRDTPLRAWDLVAFGVDGDRLGLPLLSTDRRARVERALAEVGASAYADAPVGHLSGGEQQRLLLAQALVGEPELLLLDEPLANLDLRSRRDIVMLVCKVCHARGIAVLFVAHDLNPLLHVMDQVLYLANGRSVMGTPGEVIRPEVLSQLFGFPVDVVHAEGHVLVTAGGVNDCRA